MVEGILIGILGLSAAIGSFLMPRAQEFKGLLGFMVGPGFFPFIIGTVLFLLSTAMVIREAKTGKISGEKIWVPFISKIKSGRSAIYKYLLIVAITGVYVVLLGKFPFPLVTLIYFLLFYMVNYFKNILKVRNIIKVAILSVCSTIFIAYLLPTLLQIPLP